MNLYLALILLFPFVGFLVSGLSWNQLPKKLIGTIASLCILIPFVFSVILTFNIAQTKEAISLKLFEWVATTDFNVSFGLVVDQLTSIMLLVITGIGFLIHIYSIGYMSEDNGFSRFFAYLNLFVFFMLILVMGSNYLVMFIGWEGVGLCSYLLIGFWFKNHEYNNAAKKAFIMNRIGDLALLAALFLIYINFNSLEFSVVFNHSSLKTAIPALPWITLLLFIGATGKSAQIPLFTWLPDAMAGPTPVSALIHAATMVTAGIYMIARSSILFVLTPDILHLIGYVGMITALVAASIAVFQNDIKKVLAYSTISQLGYMFAALGVGAFTGAMFHLTTHAFFKALLFLTAGSIIHALSGEQDLRKMGGLRKHLKVTSLVFLIGTIAISGIPPFSGFFSKDEILASLFESDPILWIMAIAGALMTTLYMFRVYFLVFLGKYRGSEETKKHIHESPSSMLIPLIVLAILSIFGGILGLPEWLGSGHILKDYLSPVFQKTNAVLCHTSHANISEELMLIAISVGIVAVAFLSSWYLFVKKGKGLGENPRFFKIFEQKYWLDEIYDFVFVKPMMWFSDMFHKVIEIKLIDAIVNGFGNLVVQAGSVIRLIQNGYTEFYLLVMILGIALILFFNLMF
ncbi:MAG: NADH-quinone oxidoreductase subunit L [Bacteroidota bacterium]